MQNGQTTMRIQFMVIHGHSMMVVLKVQQEQMVETKQQELQMQTMLLKIQGQNQRHLIQAICLQLTGVVELELE